MVFSGNDQCTQKHAFVSPVWSGDLNERLCTSNVYGYGEQHGYGDFSAVNHRIHKLSKLDVKGIGEGGATSVDRRTTKTMVYDVDVKVHNIID